MILILLTIIFAIWNIVTVSIRCYYEVTDEGSRYAFIREQWVSVWCWWTSSKISVLAVLNYLQRISCKYLNFLFTGFGRLWALIRQCASHGLTICHFSSRWALIRIHSCFPRSRHLRQLWFFSCAGWTSGLWILWISNLWSSSCWATMMMSSDHRWFTFSFFVA